LGAEIFVAHHSLFDENGIAKRESLLINFIHVHGSPVIQLHYSSVFSNHLIRNTKDPKSSFANFDLNENVKFSIPVICDK